MASVVAFRYAGIMQRKAYPTDLTDAQWAALAPLLPAARWWGRPRTVDPRAVCNAIRSVVRNGSPWRARPHDFPQWQIVYYDLRRWTDDGTWEAINDAVRIQVREDAGKHGEPSVGIIDSQSVNVTALPSERGYDGGKKVNGRKRSVIVDTMGFLLRVVVHAADIADLHGGKWVASMVYGLSQRLQKLVGDQHDGGQFADWVAVQYGWEAEVVSRPPDAAGFHVLPKRWIVERTFGWLTWYRRLSKDSEQLVEVSEAVISVSMIHLMLRRLDPQPAS